MTQPTVACIMLANGRPEMVARAWKSYRAQTYAERVLLQFDNDGIRSIGALRNEANSKTNCDIIVNWDSDDWSHPNRIAEQVALLQSSGAECVGYNEMLFWKELDVSRTGAHHDKWSGAWLYRAAIPAYAIGTSMCYWRETWERNSFPDRSEGCDDLEWFNSGVKIVSESAMHEIGTSAAMIASIHGGNTCSKIDAKAREWTRVPEWDSYAREAMKL